MLIDASVVEKKQASLRWKLLGVNEPLPSDNMYALPESWTSRCMERQPFAEADGFTPKRTALSSDQDAVSKHGDFGAGP